MTAKCAYQKCRKSFVLKRKDHIFCSKKCKKTVDAKRHYDLYFKSLGVWDMRRAAGKSA